MEAALLKETRTLHEKTMKVLGVNPKDARISLTYLSVAFGMVVIGGLLGLLQALDRAGFITLPAWLNYYKLLTGHGVIMVIVFTTTFSIGYLYAGLSHTLGGLLSQVRRFAWVGFVFMVAGVVLAAFTIAKGDASVMYTFYPPLKASPNFYLGLVLYMLGVWFCCFGVFINYNYWRVEHRGQVAPLFAYFTMGIFVLWFFGSLMVTIEVVMLLAWSLGWIPTVNSMICRTLFWSFGHTLVNIWYLIATSAWYVAVPKIIGGKLPSDKLARVVVILCVVLNIPGGFHHQILDPGISLSIKFLHVFMSMSIALPSLMTAYAMFVMFERTGRKLGGKGLLSWYKKLPWGDVRFLAPMIAMIAFIPAGAGGIVNTSNQLDQVIHNTMWVVGHFHLTIGMSVVLTFFGICYWLVPYLSKRKLTPQMNKLGVIQTIIWTVGMTLMSGSMHLVGLLGDPRRTAYTTYSDNPTALRWVPFEQVMAVGGVLLVIGLIIQVYAVFHMMFRSPLGETEFPLAEIEASEPPTPIWVERWGLWIVVLLLITAMAYALPVTDFIVNGPPGSAPIRTW